MGAAVGKKGPQGDINVTPLVDIVLVLLIIFMVITPLLAKNIPVEVPEKNEQEEPPEQIKDQLVLKLFSNGHIELNRTPVTAEELDQLLHDKVAAGKGAVMFFEADADAVYGQAVALMDLARGAGIGTLGMMTPDEDADGASGLGEDAYAAAYSGADAAGGNSTGQLALGTPTVLGGANIREVMGATNTLYWDLLACYEAGAAAGQALEGTVILKVGIDAAGAATSASIQSSTLESPTAETCLVGIIQRATFPADHPGTLSIPLGFRPITKVE